MRSREPKALTLAIVGTIVAAIGITANLMVLGAIHIILAVLITGAWSVMIKVYIDYILLYPPRKRVVYEYMVPTNPRLPYKRGLTLQEYDVLNSHYRDFAYTSYVDSDGHILLSNGAGIQAKYYITPKQLKRYY